MDWYDDSSVCKKCECLFLTDEEQSRFEQGVVG